jgi:hypothetical protein
MVAHGWYLSRQTDSVQPSPKAAQLKQASEELKTCSREIRAKPSYSPLLPHLVDMDTGQFTMEQLADSHIPSQQERTVLVHYFDDSQACRDRFAATTSQAVPAIGPVLAQTKLDLQTTMLQLIKGQLTWGASAQQQQDNQKATKARLQAIRL